MKYLYPHASFFSHFLRYPILPLPADFVKHFNITEKINYPARQNRVGIMPLSNDKTLQHIHNKTA